MLCLLGWYQVSEGVRTTPNDVNKRLMSALDCRHPRSVTNGLTAQVCESKQAQVEEKEQSVMILYSSTKHAVSATRCEKRVTRLTEVCGSFSHSKILGPPDILQEEVFDPAVCQSSIERLVYLKEDGTSLNIELDRAYTYKFIEHGKLQVSTNNVACQGSSILINGERHDSIVQLVTAEVRFVSVQLELDIGSAVDLDSHVRLPTACAREKVCQAGPFAYLIEHPPKECPLYVLRTLPMARTTVKTEKGEENALVSHQHKIFLLLKHTEVADSGCRPVYEVQSTNYKDLKVVLQEDQISQINALSEHISPSQVDLDLELRTSAEYLSYRFEVLLKDRLRHVAGNLCRVSQHSLGRAELSPFHKNSLLRVKGEVLQELACKPVQAEIRLGESRSTRCYTDAIPAWLNNEPVLIAAQTRLVIGHDDSQTVKCDAAYTPVFQTTDGSLVQASPEIKVVDITLTHFQSNYLHLDEEGEVMHEDYGEDILYTTQEMIKFNDLIHFSRARNLVLDSLVRKYCTGGDCGSYAPGAGSAFTLEALKDQVTKPLHWFHAAIQELERYGGLCSIVVLCFTALTLLYRIGQTLYLSLCRKVQPMQALRLSFFLNDTIRRTMIEEPLEPPPPTAAATSAPPSSTDSAYVAMPPRPSRRVEELLPAAERIPLVQLGNPGPMGNALVPYRAAPRTSTFL